jgi:predicted AAA+ superfamily ATPase
MTRHKRMTSLERGFRLYRDLQIASLSVQDIMKKFRLSRRTVYRYLKALDGMRLLQKEQPLLPCLGRVVRYRARVYPIYADY